MPGVELDLSLPSLSDTLAAVVSKTATALSTIEDDLAGQVVTSEIDINAALSASGNSLTDVASVQLIAGNAPTNAGSLYYHTDGEFYVRTGSGAIKVTSNGSVNVSAAGGFTGDYGNGTETASYDVASGEFRFTEDTGVYADLVCDDLVLNGTAGSVRFGVADSITTARQIHVASLPASGVSLLVYDASDSGLKDNADVRVPTIRVTDVDMTGVLLHPNIEASANIHGEPVVSGGSVSVSIIGSGISWVGSAVTMYVDLDVPVGCRLKTVTVVTTGPSDWVDASFAVQTHTLFPASVSTITTTRAVTTSGSQGQHVLTVSTPTAKSSGTRHVCKITYPMVSRAVAGVTYAYDRVA